MKKKLLTVLIGIFAVIGAVIAGVIDSWTVGDYYVEHRLVGPIGPTNLEAHTFTVWANGEIVLAESYDITKVVGLGCLTTLKTTYLDGVEVPAEAQCKAGGRIAEETFCQDNPEMCVAN